MKDRTVVLLIFAAIAVSLLGYTIFHAPDGISLPLTNRPVLTYAAEISELPKGSGFALNPVIDPGHGGMDGGAITFRGTYESEINLQIALRTALILRLLGLSPAMTREEDIALYDPDSRTIRQKKNSDLKNRAVFVESIPHAVLISIHQNSFPQGQYHGAQVFHNGNEENIAFATVMQEQLRLSLDTTNKRKVKKVNVYLMNHVTCPAILIECGFLSNTEEENLLRDSSYQLKFAAAVCGGLIEWEKTNSRVGA